MKRKQIGALILAVAVVFSGCSGTANTRATSEVAEETVAEETISEDVTEENVEEEVEEVEEDIKEDAEETVDEEAEAEESLEEKEVKEEVVYTQEELVNMDSVSFAKLMRAGWNLGNTLDANSSKGLESETSWNQPKATQELVSYVKEVGFSSIRIPVSWGNHVDENYQIDPEWMARVKEVVDYAYNENLYVIINSHHDNDYYYPSDENEAEAEKFLTTIWEQIAEEFKDYDNHLVFESMNEPRLAGTDIEWWFAMSDPKGKAAIEVICKLNQAFVNTVRATGGNNENRFLMVPSYAANPDFALNSSFSMPEDSAENKLMLSVHAYTPYDFAGSPSGYSDWDGSKNYEFNFMGKLMSTFILNGYGVVIGEFGATNKDNEEDRIKWAKGYTGKAASYGIPYFVWDNAAVGVGEENFGVIDRQNLTLSFPAVFAGYMDGLNYMKE